MAHISFCVPCGPSHVTLLNRTLHFFAKQTCTDFEVVVCFDGFDGSDQVTSHPFLKTTHFERPAEAGELGHRNHCRNKAAKLATGEYLWFWDADVLPDDTLVAQAIAVLKQNPRHLSICPTMAAIRPNRGVFLDETSNESLLYKCRLEDSIYPYTHHKFRASMTPRLDQKLRISEGYPCVPRHVYDFLEGFDERYLGWGRNKEEFVARLNMLAPDHKYQLLYTTQCYVLPHDPDPSKRDVHLMFTNDKRFGALREDYAEYARDLRKRYRECSS